MTFSTKPQPELDCPADVEALIEKLKLLAAHPDVTEAELDDCRANVEALINSIRQTLDADTDAPHRPQIDASFFGGES